MGAADLLSGKYTAAIQDQQLKNFIDLFVLQRICDVTQTTHFSDITIQQYEKVRADQEVNKSRPAQTLQNMCSLDSGNNAIMYRNRENTFIEVDWSVLRSWL